MKKENNGEEVFVDKTGVFAGEDEAIDEHGNLKDGYRFSVPMMMRDAMPPGANDKIAAAVRATEVHMQDEARAQAYALSDADNRYAWMSARKRATRARSTAGPEFSSG